MGYYRVPKRPRVRPKIIVAGVVKRLVMEGMEVTLGRKDQKNQHRKVTDDVETRIYIIACSNLPEGVSRWTLPAIADELVRLEVVDYITDSTICAVMKKRNQTVACNPGENMQAGCK